MKTTVFAVLGVALLVGGITLAFRDWVFIQMVFRGVIGPLLAVVGLVLLTMVKH